VIDDEAALLRHIRLALRGIDPWPPRGSAVPSEDFARKVVAHLRLCGLGCHATNAEEVACDAMIKRGRPDTAISVPPLEDQANRKMQKSHRTFTFGSELIPAIASAIAATSAT
jgi:hypothetical protein